MPAIYSIFVQSGPTVEDVQQLIHGTNVWRNDAIRGVEPTPLEFPEANSGDVATVWLNDGSREVWQHDGTSWVLQQTLESPVVLPDLNEYDDVVAIDHSPAITVFDDGPYGVAFTNTAPATFTIPAGAVDDAEVKVSRLGTDDVLVIDAGGANVAGDPTGAVLNEIGTVTFKRVSGEWVVTEKASI